MYNCFCNSGCDINFRLYYRTVWSLRRYSHKKSIFYYTNMKNIKNMWYYRMTLKGIRNCKNEANYSQLIKFAAVILILIREWTKFYNFLFKLILYDLEHNIF